MPDLLKHLRLLDTLVHYSCIVIIALFKKIWIYHLIDFFSDAVGATVSLSTQYHNDCKQLDVLVLCNRKKYNRTDNKEHNEGNLLMLLSVYTQKISGRFAIKQHT